MEQQRALREAIAAIEAGDQLAGRQMLSQILRSDPGCAEAWLWMSRIAEHDTQRQECLRRALSPNQADMAAGPRTRQHPAQPLEESTSPFLTLAESPPPATSGGDELRVGPVMTTRSSLQALSPPLTEMQRQVGQRNIMLAGAMVCSLFCGLALLLFVVSTVVPAAHERLRRRYESTPYEAILWCPSCEQSGEPVILWDRPGRLFSTKVGALAHATAVTVVAEEWAKMEGRVYVEVQAATESGWVRSTYLRQ